MDEQDGERAGSLHYESLCFSGLIAGADAFLTDLDYQHHLGEASVGMAKFTVC